MKLTSSQNSIFGFLTRGRQYQYSANQWVADYFCSDCWDL